jgi:hypothetical protein
MSAQGAETQETRKKLKAQKIGRSPQQRERPLRASSDFSVAERHEISTAMPTLHY